MSSTENYSYSEKIYNPAIDPHFVYMEEYKIKRKDVSPGPKVKKNSTAAPYNPNIPDLKIYKEKSPIDIDTSVSPKLTKRSAPYRIDGI